MDNYVCKKLYSILYKINRFMHLASLLLTRDHVLVGYKQILKIMSKEAILEKVRSIVAEQLSVDAGEVKPASNFQNDLGADSLDTVELVMALEEAFDIEIPDEAAEGIATVGDAVKYIEDKQSGGSNG